MKSKQTKGGKNRWEDHYARKAKKEQFPARSVYKLKEMQAKHRLIKKGDRILDLGCFPGSWLLYAAELTGKNGHVTGIDLKPVSIRIPSNVTVFTEDIIRIDSVLSKDKKFNVIISDMAPDTTGNKLVDNVRSFNLCCEALSVAKTYLFPHGAFICKIFHGEDFIIFTKFVKQNFKKQIIFKPQCSRKGSREIFIIGLEFIQK